MMGVADSLMSNIATRKKYHLLMFWMKGNILYFSILNGANKSIIIKFMPPYFAIKILSHLRE